MKKFGLTIWRYFSEINYKSLWSSCSEVLWLTTIAFCPLLANIAITSLILKDVHGAFVSKVIPGEILSYCASFFAPSLYLLVKTQGTSYKLPLLKFFSVMTIIIYLCSVILYLIAKNKWVENIDMEHHDFDLYFKLSLTFLAISILFRIYSIYHGSFSNWSNSRKQQQEEFNRSLADRLNSSK